MDKGCGIIIDEIIITCGDEHGRLCDKCSENVNKANEVKDD